MNFASAILFPFANRVENGEFMFNNFSYKLASNEKGSKNAIHGLIFNKVFECEKTEVSESSASIKLCYKETEGKQGFPFKYNIQLIYTLTREGLVLKIIAENTDEKPFPFTLGWHPYFVTENVQLSKLNFTSKDKYKTNSNDITIDSEPFEKSNPFKIDDEMIDGAFSLVNGAITLATPKYKVNVKSSLQENYLQIYKPYQANIIAIEPMTGVSDSLNNKIGLKTLEPKHKFEVEWLLNVLKN